MKPQINVVSPLGFWEVSVHSFLPWRWTFEKQWSVEPQFRYLLSGDDDGKANILSILEGQIRSWISKDFEESEEYSV